MASGHQRTWDWRRTTQDPWDMVWIVYLCTPPNVYVETLLFNVMVFGDGAFGRWISALVRRENRGLASSTSAV